NDYRARSRVARPASRSRRSHISTKIRAWIQTLLSTCLHVQACHIHKSPREERNVHSATRPGESKFEKFVSVGPGSDRAETETCRAENIRRRRNRRNSSPVLRADADKDSCCSNGAGQNKTRRPPAPANLYLPA